MSAPELPPEDSRPPSRAVATVMMVLGIILLLPGLCSLISAAIMLSTPGFGLDVYTFMFAIAWLITGLIAWGGVAMIRAANRRFAARRARDI
jgi:hypothetical protein